jgi:hypothetical protein
MLVLFPFLKLYAGGGAWPRTCEETLNQLGDDLLAAKRSETAVEPFRINTTLYPDSGNACDRLAETETRSAAKTSPDRGIPEPWRSSRMTRMPKPRGRFSRCIPPAKPGKLRVS